MNFTSKTVLMCLFAGLTACSQDRDFADMRSHDAAQAKASSPESAALASAPQFIRGNVELRFEALNGKMPAHWIVAVQKYLKAKIDMNVRATEDKGLFAWDVPYTMEALLRLYQISGDSSFLVAAVEVGDLMLRQLDDKAGISDYLGRSKSVWSIHSVHGPKNKRYSYIGVVGAGFSPLLHAATLIAREAGRNGGVKSSLSYKAKNLSDWGSSFVSAWEAAEQFINADYRDTAGQGGTFAFVPDAVKDPTGAKLLEMLANRRAVGSNVAVNYHAWIANAYLEAQRYYSNVKSKTRYAPTAARAKALAIHLKRVMGEYANGREVFEWGFADYIMDKANPARKRAEDVGHGNFIIAAAMNFQRSKIVFTDQDVQKMANTFELLMEETDDDGLPKYDLINRTFQFGPDEVYMPGEKRAGEHKEMSKSIYHWIEPAVFSATAREEALKFVDGHLSRCYEPVNFVFAELYHDK